MINGLGIVGWGVGGIEAEAGMLGQPVYFLTPEVVGVHMTGALREGVTATDLALHVTEMLRKQKVVGKFVEFYGPGAASLPLPDRATIANMAPEYGATMGYFPVDAESVNYLKATGRTKEQVEAFETYFKAQKLFGIPTKADGIVYSSDLELNLGDVSPSVAGPKRPQDRIALPDLKSKFLGALDKAVTENGFGKKGAESAHAVVTLNGTRPKSDVDIKHGSVLIAAITSCTNTSNPSVMLAAGLLAKKAVEKGLTVNAAVKTSLAPGSRVVTDYLDKTGLQPYLDKLGFRSSATAARPASATPARSIRSSTRRSPRAISSRRACSPAIATSRRASIRASRRTSLCRRRSSWRSRSPARSTSISTPSRSARARTASRFSSRKSGPRSRKSRRRWKAR